MSRTWKAATPMMKTVAANPNKTHCDSARRAQGVGCEKTSSEVRSRINFTDIAASPLLRKPSGNHHKGLLVAGFNASAAPGDAARARYDLFLNWILNGAPQ